MGQQRYLRARLPWIAIDASDVSPQGDPETVVFLRGTGSLIGLHIKGVEGHVMLGIREDAHGQPVTCAITNEIQIDTYHVQSGGPRARADGFDPLDGVSDDDP